MAYTDIQKLRKMRATNKGSNRRLAGILRRTAAWLDKKGPAELAASEIKQLQGLTKAIAARLHANAYTKAFAEGVAKIEKLKKSGNVRLRRG